MKIDLNLGDIVQIVYKNSKCYTQYGEVVLINDGTNEDESSVIDLKLVDDNTKRTGWLLMDTRHVRLVARGDGSVPDIDRSGEEIIKPRKKVSFLPHYEEILTPEPGTPFQWNQWTTNQWTTSGTTTVQGNV